MSTTNNKLVREINSVWTQESGRWDSGKEKYVNCTKKTKEKKLTMEIVHQIDSPRSPLLMFIGGPTGYENYYLEDLKNSLAVKIEPSKDRFCICGGTINRWAECIVSAKEVLKFIQEYTL